MALLSCKGETLGLLDDGTVAIGFVDWQQNFYALPACLVDDVGCWKRHGNTWSFHKLDIGLCHSGRHEKSRKAFNPPRSFQPCNVHAGEVSFTYDGRRLCNFHMPFGVMKVLLASPTLSWWRCYWQQVGSCSTTPWLEIASLHLRISDFLLQYTLGDGFCRLGAA